MAMFFCEHCQKPTAFLPIVQVLKITGVSRSTLYYWMEHAWIHWRELPSGRRVICVDSLSHEVRTKAPIAISAKRIRPKVSKTVRFCPIP